MTRARRELLSLDATPYYHCVSRCVRRAFLCGQDPVTGRNYEHRRGWIEDKLLNLADIFALDVCAYAVMSNHYHLVLHINQAQAEQWSVADVIQRWHSLFNGALLSQRFVNGETLSNAEQAALNELVTTWRQRLMDISWFMRVLNEAIARQANREDQCTGRFWEGRFKSQALLDEKALAACMAYVDLNPIRAKIATTPETSDYTSIKTRIQTSQNTEHPNRIKQQPCQLAPFAGNPRQNMPAGIPMRLSDYLDLVDWTGRALRTDKRGAIPDDLPPLLERLTIEPKHWLYMTQHFESRFKQFVGTAYRLKQVCQSLGYQRTVGFASCKTLLPQG